jgi:hypothetical protein
MKVEYRWADLKAECRRVESVRVVDMRVEYRWVDPWVECRQAELRVLNCFRTLMVPFPLPQCGRISFMISRPSLSPRSAASSGVICS